MKILVNYEPGEKQFLSQLNYFIKNAGHTAVATSAVHEVGELLQKAKNASCDGILLCNAATLRNLVPGKNPTLDQYRGSRLNYSIPVIVCNSLAHINTVNHGSWLLEKDLSKFAYARKPSPGFTFTALDHEVKFAGAYQNLSKAVLIAFDVETDKVYPEGCDEDSIQGPDSIITCCSWTGLMPSGELLTYVLPLVDFGVDHWKTDAEYAEALKLMQKINDLPIPKVMQNGLYDAVHTIRYRAAPRNWCLDTMAMAHSEYSELPKSLDFIASYTLSDYKQWKTESEEASKVKDIQRYWAYNGQDTWYTLRICVEQLKKMPAYARRNFADKFKLVYPALYCAFEGWLIDNEVREKLQAEQQIILNRSLERLRIMFADPNFNPGSWQQVQHYIYKVFGAKHPKLGTSKSGTDEKNLNAVAEQHPLLAMICTEILDYRGAQKAIGTYFTFQQLQSRLLYAINPFGTETERMACQASSLWVGTQVQNVPQYAKPMLVADPGFEAAEIDNSQSEARCTAYCAEEEALIAALEAKGKDFYKQLGTLFFQIPYEEVTPFFRNKVLKKINHGTNYMMAGKTFIENIGAKILYETAGQIGIKIVQVKRAGKNNAHEMTLLGFATHLLELYHVPFAKVRVWYKKIKDEVATTHMLKSPLGHVRYFFGDITKQHKILRSAVAHQPQNLSVTILNKGFYKIYKQLVLPSKGRFRLKAQVHDSVVAQYPAGERHIWVPKMMELMDNPVEVHGRILRIPLDAKCGPCWAEDLMEKYKQPVKEAA